MSRLMLYALTTSHALIVSWVLWRFFYFAARWTLQTSVIWHGLQRVLYICIVFAHYVFHCHLLCELILTCSSTLLLCLLPQMPAPNPCRKWTPLIVKDDIIFGEVKFDGVLYWLFVPNIFNSFEHFDVWTLSNYILTQNQRPVFTTLSKPHQNPRFCAGVKVSLRFHVGLIDKSRNPEHSDKL